MKQSEIKELSVEELTLKLATLRKEYEDMKITHAVSPLENPMLIRKVKVFRCDVCPDEHTRSQLVKAATNQSFMSFKRG